jgi:hypothetical protein
MTLPILEDGMLNVDDIDGTRGASTNHATPIVNRRNQYGYNLLQLLIHTPISLLNIDSTSI